MEVLDLGTFDTSIVNLGYLGEVLFFLESSSESFELYLYWLLPFFDNLDSVLGLILILAFKNYFSAVFYEGLLSDFSSEVYALV